LIDIVYLNILVLVYILAVGYLGYKGWRETCNSEDYMVGGRKIHPYVMAMSYGATFISTSAIVGFGGTAGLFGMGLLWLTFLNIFVGIFIAFVVFGKRTRKMGYNLSAMTFPELLARRFESRFIQYFSGLVIFVGMPMYASVVLIGAARFIETTLAIDFNLALMLFSLIIAAYVVIGGLKGVMYTDAFQATIMFVGMAFLLVMTYSHLGGITQAHQALTNLAALVPANLAAMGHLGWTAMPAAGSAWWWTLVSTLVLGVGIGVLAMPQLVVRFMTVKSGRELNRAVLIGGVFILMMTGVAFVVGALSNVYFFERDGVIAIAAAAGNSDSIIPVYINTAMPSWFVYIFMLTLLAAAMSTLSSQFHAQGTAIGRDVYETVVGTRGGRSILITRIGIIIAVVVAVILGYFLPPQHHSSRYGDLLRPLRRRLPPHVYLRPFLEEGDPGRSDRWPRHRDRRQPLLAGLRPSEGGGSPGDRQDDPGKGRPNNIDALARRRPDRGGPAPRLRSDRRRQPRNEAS
jgi:SSS family solute:Na+ symporter